MMADMVKQHTSQHDRGSLDADTVMNKLLVFRGSLIADAMLILLLPIQSMILRKQF